MGNSVPSFFGRQMARFMGKDVIARLLKSSAKASAWVGISLGAKSVIRLASNFIMARLLMPEAFGLVGIAFTVQFAVAMLTDIGLNGSVIRSDRGSDPAYLRTVWVTQIVRNLLIAVVVWGVCLALWLNREGLPPESIWAMDIAPMFIAVAAFQAVLGGFESPSVMFAQRNLDLKRLVIMEIVTRSSAIPIMVGCAMAGLGPWSLLLGSLGSELIRVIGSHFWLHGPRMAFQFEKAAFMEIFHFGKWLLVASLAGFVIGRGDQLIFGSLFTATNFSLYVVAGIWIRVINEGIRSLIRKICFPAIAQCRRQDLKSVPRVYKRFRMIADVVAIAAFLTMTLGADVLFTWFYKPEYEPAKEFVPYLAFMLLFAPHILINAVVLAGGDSRNYMIVRSVGAIGLVVGVPLIYSHFGAMPAVLAFGLSGIVNLPVSLWALSRQIKVDFWTEARILLFGLGAIIALFTLG